MISDDGVVLFPDLGAIKHSLEVAESLARASLMTPRSAKKRLVARSIELGQHDYGNGDYIPPKELLIYLVR